MAQWQITCNNHFKIGSTYGYRINMSCSTVAHQLIEVKLLSSMKNSEYIILSGCRSGEWSFRHSDEDRLSLLQCKASSGQACFTSLSPCRGVLNMLQQTISNISCLQTPQMFLHELISFVSLWWKIVAVCHGALEITYPCENTSFSAFRGKYLKYLGYSR